MSTDDRMICLYVSQARKLINLLDNEKITGEYTVDEAGEYGAIREYLMKAVTRSDDRHREAKDREMLT